MKAYAFEYISEFRSCLIRFQQQLQNPYTYMNLDIIYTQNFYSNDAPM